MQAGSGEIVVRIPEEGFIFLGDLFHAWHVLPIFSRSVPELGAERWLSVLDNLLEETEIQFISRSNGSEGWSPNRLCL
jgi:glyoxylase-like metal-dependent hydrolase (beta-lactamase superfamily II)